MRAWLAVVLVWIFGGASAWAQTRAPDTYVVRPILHNGAAEGLGVTLSFQGEADGETLLVLPNEWGGEKELWKALTDWRVDGGLISDGAQPQFKLVRHHPNALVRVSYVVRQDQPDATDAAALGRYRPKVQPTYIEVLGNAAFAHTPGSDDRAVHVRFEGVPQGWTLASDLEHSATLTEHDLIESVILMGTDVTIYTPRAGPSGVRLATRDGWALQPQDIADTIGAIIAAQRAFWGSGPDGFLVTMLPYAPPQPGSVSMGGTGRGDAFAFYATINADGAKLTRILAHESLHSWIPRRIGAMRDGPDEPLDYWISEGFTEFFTDRLLVRANQWTAQDFAAELNEVLLHYAFSPERAAPNARIAQAFWSNDAVQKLPYQRGRLIAFLWDAQVRAASNGRADLDDVVLAMQISAKREKQQPVRESLVATLRTFGVLIEPQLARFIDAGEPILLPSDSLAPCGVIETLMVGPFHRGFDIEATTAKKNVITGVIATSPAHAAGLRDGMKLISREAGAIGDPTQDIAYRVEDAGVERVIRYRPEGEGEKRAVQRLVLNPLRDMQVCRMALAGFG